MFLYGEVNVEVEYTANITGKKREGMAVSGEKREINSTKLVMLDSYTEGCWLAKSEVLKQWGILG